MIDALMYGMIPREKISAVFQRAATEQIKQRGQTASGALAERSAKPFLQNSLIHTRCRDRSAQTHNHNYGQRKQNAPAQLRYLDAI